MESRPLVGIRHEDKSRWERRAPLAPEHVRRLVEHHGIDVAVQTSPTRIFGDAAYAAAGARVVEDLHPCRAILGVKEIPAAQLIPGMTYANFSHVIKGQPQNMGMLRTLLERGCDLFDYEKVVDDRGRRIIFFGWHAGFAGMIESLWALGQRLRARGVDTPLADVRRPYKYADEHDAKQHIQEIGERLERDGIPPELQPLVVGVVGYGNVARGAQDVLDQLPTAPVTPAHLLARDFGAIPLDRTLVKVVFAEEHLVEPTRPGMPFELQDYYGHPEHYRSMFARYLPDLSLIVNCIYWEERYPRLVTRADVRQMYGTTGGPASACKPRLQVIGDISCDIEGSIEVCLRNSTIDSPVFVYRPDTDTTEDGVDAVGPVIMSIDHLPCEMPADATRSFGDALVDFVAPLAHANYAQPLDTIDLPAELQRALIVHRGALTPSYDYLKDHIGAKR